MVCGHRSCPQYFIPNEQGSLFSWKEPGVRPVTRLFGVTEAWVQRLGTSTHPPILR